MSATFMNRGDVDLPDDIVAGAWLDEDEGEGLMRIQRLSLPVL